MPESAPAEERIIQATLRCIERWGVAKTSLDDVAAEAGVGRSTVYRAFPGGKGALIDAATEHEVARYVHEFEIRVLGAEGLEETVVEALVLGAEALRNWPAVRDLVAFRAAETGMGPDHSQQVLLQTLHGLLPQHLHRYLEPAVADRIVDWGARLGLSYATVPDHDPDHDLTDRDAARRFFQQLLLPAINAAQTVPTNA